MAMMVKLKVAMLVKVAMIMKVKVTMSVKVKVAMRVKMNLNRASWKPSFSLPRAHTPRVPDEVLINILIIRSSSFKGQD